MLKAERLEKQLGGIAVLSDVNVEVSAGQILALIGPSGCGKTTLLRCLSLLSAPESGRIAIGDRQFLFPSSEETPWRIIYPELTGVPQHFPLWPHLRVISNLELPLELGGIEKKTDEMAELYEDLGISNYLKRFPMELSVGQRQRVAFARALLLRPKYLLLDEITSAQDVEHIKKIMKLIRRAAAEGTAIIIATHLIGFARRVASHFCFIDHGRVVESGSTTSLKEPKSDRLKDFLLVGDEI